MDSKTQDVYAETLACNAGGCEPGSGRSRWELRWNSGGRLLEDFGNGRWACVHQVEDEMNLMYTTGWSLPRIPAVDLKQHYVNPVYSPGRGSQLEHPIEDPIDPDTRGQEFLGIMTWTRFELHRKRGTSLVGWLQLCLCVS